MDKQAKLAAIKTARQALETVQDSTREEFPIGTILRSPRGRGIAEFKVTGYPEADSIQAALSVLGESQNGKVQTISTEKLV